MYEIVASIHNHTRYSDGSGNHEQLIRAALDAGIDVLITNDHNVLVRGADQYTTRGDQHLLMLAAEEIHDQARMPQKNHMLVIGARKELAQFAYSPQELIHQAEEAGAATFLAHPYESDLPLFHEPDISWVDWDVQGFTGLELWNHFSEFKDVGKNIASALYYAFFPADYPRGPQRETLERWDRLLTAGQRVVAVGGVDAHALLFHLAFFHKVIFPYKFHYTCINTHLLLEEELNHDLEHDRSLVLQALKGGSAFVGYDLPASTRGFSFTAETDTTKVSMGQSILIDKGATLRIHLPRPVRTQLIYNGMVVKQWEGNTQLVTTADKAGAYRVECSIHFRGMERGWIYSNPIYVEKPGKDHVSRE